MRFIDGKRTIEQIAKGTSAKAFRQVTPDNVRALLAKLVPLGLVAGADGTLAPSAREEAARSPMQVQQFHDTAVAHGGTSIEEPPGLREGKLGPMHLAYVRDPDGNKLCALHRPK